MKNNEKIYLDYASATPVNKEVSSFVVDYFDKHFGNAGSPHSFGQEAIKAVDSSREIISSAIGADFREIIFLSSATEANNLALRGALKAYKSKNKEGRPRIIVSSIEHSSVLDTAKDMESNEDIELVVIPASETGVVDMESLKAALSDNTILVSIMHVNNETGVIQPISEVSKAIQDFKNNSSSNEAPYPLFHSDGVQGLQFLSCNVDELGVDLMTLSAHKIYSPKGAASLYVRDSISEFIKPITTGGTQEFGLKAGTINVPAVAGFGRAVELVIKDQDRKRDKVQSISEKFLRGITDTNSKVQINGTSKKVPHILNLYFPGKKSDELLIRLDMMGIAVSSGSACASRAIKPSHVLGALGHNKERVSSSLRFSFGEPTTEEEIDKSLRILKDII